MRLDICSVYKKWSVFGASTCLYKLTATSHCNPFAVRQHQVMTAIKAHGRSLSKSCPLKQQFKKKKKKNPKQPLLNNMVVCSTTAIRIYASALQSNHAIMNRAFTLKGIYHYSHKLVASFGPIIGSLNCLTGWAKMNSTL